MAKANSTRRNMKHSLSQNLVLICTVWILCTHGIAAQPVSNNAAVEVSPWPAPSSASTSSYQLHDIEPLKKAHCSDVHHIKDKCAFVQDHCDDVDAGLLSYLDLYFCKMYGLTPIYWVMMLVWLSTLFASIGVSASDYLTLNLATISTKWHLSGTVAGVTLLALGNGSPDLFSTFLAMGSNSGSLAIGELIGAAGFITTVVAGATAIPRPFRVKKYDFMRDILCFAAAVAFSMFFLIDGHLAVWECVIMVLGYVGYVILVVCWDVIMKRVKKNKEQQARARGHFTASESASRSRDISPVAMGDIDGNATMETPGAERQALTNELPRDQTDDDDEDSDEREQLIASFADISNEMTVTHRHRRTFSRMASIGQTIRPSLLGAAEFGSVLSSLEKSRATRTRSSSPQQRRHSTGPSKLLSAQRYSDGGESGQSTDSRTQRSQARSEIDSLAPPDRAIIGRIRAVSASAADGLSNGQIHAAAIAGGLHVIPGSIVTLEPQSSADTAGQDVSSEQQRPEVPRLQIPVPTINVSDETGQLSAATAGDESTLVFPRYTDDPGAVVTSPSSLTPVEYHSQGSRQRSRDRFFIILSWLRATFLPQILPWKSKNWFDKTLSIITIPVIVGLTLTVPIGEIMVDQPKAVTPASNSQDARKDSTDTRANAGQASRLSSASVSPLLSPSSEIGDPLTERDPTGEDETWDPYLISLQIVCAPQFCFFVIAEVWAGVELSTRATIIWCCSISGVSLLLLLLFWITKTPSRVPTWQPWLAFPGFVVAIAWISLIANEVVGVLKTFQLITGFSEAILGLLIFAAGNSVSDFFANLNTARAGRPVMAFHACFGGPMLNILTGIGVGGIYHIAKKIAKHDGDSIHAGTQFHIDVGRTLIVSGSGLLFTLLILLISLWRNQWIMDRRIGLILSSIWATITVVNVILEWLQLNGTIKPW